MTANHNCGAGVGLPGLPVLATCSLGSLGGKSGSCNVRGSGRVFLHDSWQAGRLAGRRLVACKPVFVQFCTHGPGRASSYE